MASPYRGGGSGICHRRATTRRLGGMSQVGCFLPLLPDFELMAFFSADGSFKPPPLPPRPSNASSNPFYVPPPSSASDAASRSQRRPPPSVPSKPTPPPRAPSLVTGDLLGLDDLSDALPTVAAPAASKPPPAAFQTRRKPPPPMPRSTSPISVRSADTVAGTGIAGEVGGEKTGPPPVPRRPAGERGAIGNFEEVASQATGGSWTVI